MKRSKPIFAARLTPYRSLGDAGFMLLMAFICVTCFISGMLFLIIGAWPVFLFFGLDVLLVWGAFKLNYHSGRESEEIEVWRDQVEFRQISANGQTRIHQFNPFWTRFHVDRHDEIGITRMVLAEKDRFLDIGSFLNPHDREGFARALGSALARAKAG